MGKVVAVGVPIIVGDAVIGIIALENYEQEDAFSDSDVNLLHDPRQLNERRPGKCASI